VTRAGLVAFVLCVLPLGAAAQSADVDQPVSQGPMTLERIHSGFVVAPDFKITEVDNRTSGLAGAYAGWLTDETILVGGGGYWLANQASDRKMAYGGLVVQWLVIKDRRIGFSAKGLVGGGRATLGDTITQFARTPEITNSPLRGFDPRTVDGVTRGTLTSTRVRVHQDFFLVEPEADLVVRLARNVRLVGGVGYRLTSTERRDDDRLRRATGSLAVQIGGGS
jgi:hypothetical protein